MPSSHWQLPEFETHELRPGQRGRCCVAVFVLNEGERIRRQLTRMQPVTDAAGIDVVVADGGSTDGGSTDTAFLASVGVHTLLIKRSPGKLGTQMRMAFAHAMRAGYPGLICMDGNDKDDPSALVRFADDLDAGWDHVQGSRFVRGGRSINCPPDRYWGIRLLHAPAISLAAGFRYTDTTNGFRAYSRRFLLDRRVSPFRDCFTGYELHYYLAIRAAVLGFRVKEIPVTRAYPDHGPTPTKIHGLRGNLKVLGALARMCLGEGVP